MNEKKILSMLGLATKAGKIITGEDACVNAIRSGKATLVFVAADASAGTRKKFTDKTTYYKVPILTVFTKEQLQGATGKQNRASIVLADEGFTKSIQKLIADN